ncbi:MAG: hypothetical protein ACE5Q6_00865 [Dehalococcoidia bacterium]
MVKVSITLPNNAQITFESEESEVIHEVVGMVLRDLPRDLMGSPPVTNGNGANTEDTEKSNGVMPVSTEAISDVVTLSAVSEPTSELAVEASPVHRVTLEPESVPESTPQPTIGRADQPVAPPVPVLGDLTETEQSFVRFCQAVNPLGDMRRVVVAAEGAARFLGLASVDAEELGRLFDLAGWPRPHSFVQTMRNAGRSKFRWLERIPGRSGFYRVTDVGRETALGD